MISTFKFTACSIVLISSLVCPLSFGQGAEYNPHSVPTYVAKFWATKSLSYFESLNELERKNVLSAVISSPETQFAGRQQMLSKHLLNGSADLRAEVYSDALNSVDSERNPELYQTLVRDVIQVSPQSAQSYVCEKVQKMSAEFDDWKLNVKQVRKNADGIQQLLTEFSGFRGLSEMSCVFGSAGAESVSVPISQILAMTKADGRSASTTSLRTTQCREDQVVSLFHQRLQSMLNTIDDAQKEKSRAFQKQPKSARKLKTSESEFEQLMVAREGECQVSGLLVKTKSEGYEFYPAEERSQPIQNPIRFRSLTELVSLYKARFKVLPASSEAMASNASKDVGSPAVLVNPWGSASTK